uniref:Uncharacterized protein n=1 Tax=Karlodinium veneficum TaxID=407301 RepID=A7YXY9_KARVE|nr:conserved hypothetical protein [Karlodinium veneficum]ABV22269.1 conserved hypothetical protein [Karlodinium veneficum]
MTSIVDSKTAARAYKSCLKEKGAAECLTQRAQVVKGVSAAVKDECSPYTEDFFGCFMHRYRLSSCTDATVKNMLKCQEKLAGTILSVE